MTERAGRLAAVITEGLETGALTLPEVELVAAFVAALATTRTAEREGTEDA